MHSFEKQYYYLVREIRNNPDSIVPGRLARTKSGFRASFDKQIKCENVKDNFPLLMIKRTSLKIALIELYWMLLGSNNTEFLNKHKIKIWDSWADEKGNLGPVYGYQWRNFGGTDQIYTVFNSLRLSPFGRRHIISAWNVGDLPEMKLPPCHYAMQFHCTTKSNVMPNDFESYPFENADITLNLTVNMRSSDILIGLPYNVAFYAAMLYIFSTALGYKTGNLTMNLANAHIYDNQLAGADEVIERYLRNAKLMEIEERPIESSLDMKPMFRNLLLDGVFDSDLITLIRRYFYVNTDRQLSFLEIPVEV